MLGMRIPEDMEGRVLTELFEKPPVIESETAPAKELAGGEGNVYSDQELQQVTERLMDLGYLE